MEKGHGVLYMLYRDVGRTVSRALALNENLQKVSICSDLLTLYRTCIRMSTNKGMGCYPNPLKPIFPSALL